MINKDVYVIKLYFKVLNLYYTLFIVDNCNADVDDVVDCIALVIFISLFFAISKILMKQEVKQCLRIR